MRHGKKFNHLGRQASHRKAMLANMSCSLIEHKRINTTVAKAKALRKYLEPLLTKSKTDSTHSRRTIFSYLNSKEAVAELFREVAPKIAERPGGYVRIIRTGNRLGDNAEMCMIELVDFNTLYSKDKAGAAKKGRTRRAGSTKKVAGESAAAGSDAATPTAEVETPAAEAKTPKAKVETPKAEVETPQAEVETPQAEVETPQANVETPQADVETPSAEGEGNTEEKKGE